jgi:hypothetical protein
VLPKQIKQADVTRMLYQLRLVADRRGDDETTFSRMSQAPDLLPANESAIVVTPPADPAPEPPSGGISGGVSGGVGNSEAAQLLPQMSLEIRAALGGPLQEELTALRGFISSALESHTERLQGELLALAPARAAVDTPPLVAERRAWPAIVAACLALLSAGAAALLGWLWWQQGGELAAARTDLAAAYTEIESLRARPAVVSPAPASVAPVDAAVAAGTALVPAEDALDPPAADPASAATTASPAAAPMSAPTSPPTASATPVVVPAAPAAAPSAAQAQ